MPSATVEEYLETIYKISLRGPVRPTQIAESIGVSAPTVTATLKRLSAQGLVVRQKGDVILTEEGRAHALDIIRRHRLAERFLVDVLGLEWDEAHEDACLLEHALSPRVQAALEQFLDNPDVCPHGHPIPSAEGVVPAIEGIALSDVESGLTVRVVQVPEDDDALLTRLSGQGIVPGALVKVMEASGSAPLLLGVDGHPRAMARDAAHRILVDPVPALED